MNIPVLGIFVTTLLDGRIFKENIKKYWRHINTLNHLLFATTYFAIYCWYTGSRRFIFSNKSYPRTCWYCYLFYTNGHLPSEKYMYSWRQRFWKLFQKNSRTQLSWSAVFWTIFYFIMHVIKINNFFTSSFAFLKINGMKKMWNMYLLSAFLKKIFPWKCAVILAWLLFLSKWDQTKQTFKLTIYNLVFIR